VRDARSSPSSAQRAGKTTCLNESGHHALKPCAFAGEEDREDGYRGPGSGGLSLVPSIAKLFASMSVEENLQPVRSDCAGAAPESFERVYTLFPR